ncbi:MAG: choice-of-anchor D domain-containing protein, partial [Candidatus Acidiferrales bacterium]
MIPRFLGFSSVLALCITATIWMAKAQSVKPKTEAARNSGGSSNITLTPVITTAAGDGTSGYSGDNGPATSAELWSPDGAALDSTGNLYIVDYGNNRIRKVNTSGIITTVAGTGTEGYSGDNGPATSAELSGPSAVAVDSAGNLYIADCYNNRIRKVNTSGTITTVAGNGTGGYGGDNGPSTSAELNAPTGVAVDTAGDFYIVDYGNNRIRKVNTSGTITTVAGDGVEGYSGDNGPATSAELNSPWGMTVDSIGDLYIADASNDRIREVNTSGTITTVAGNGTQGYSGDNGPATSAEFWFPSGVAVDSAGDLFIADNDNNRIRMVDAATGIITTVAGDGAGSYSGDNGPATSGGIHGPFDVVLDSAGNLYIADSGDNRIRKVSTVSTNFGQVHVGANGTQNVFLTIDTALTLSSVQASGDDSVLSNSCALNTPLSANTMCTLQVQFTPTKPGQRWFPLVLTDSSGNNYSFGLEGTGVGSAAAFTPGIISTVAGDGFGAGSFGEEGGYSGDNGPATSAELYLPLNVAVDSAGNLYIADQNNNRVRKVNTGGTITTVAGNGNPGYSGDNGAATSAELNQPAGVAVDSAGNLYIADFNNNRVRVVNANGIITTVVGDGTQGYAGDGGAATSAELGFPLGVAVDSADNLYIADSYNSRIRKVDNNGIITTVAGDGTSLYSGDGGPATSAGLSVWSVAVDSAGNLYIADPVNSRVREVGANGIITTVAGDGTQGYAGDGGAATSAELNTPQGVAVDSAGEIYIAEEGNNRVRKVDTNGIITTVVGTGYEAASGAGGYTGDGGPATSAELYRPTGVAVDSTGNLYIADNYNNVIRGVSASTSALSFANESVDGTSSSLSVAVSDVGTAALNFSSIVAPYNFTVQSVGNDCVSGTPLAIGNTCDVGVAFAPNTAGPLTGTLTINDDAFNSSQTTALSGTGISELDVNIPAGDTAWGAVSSSPAGIACGSTCSAEFSVPTVVLTAAPNAGNTFTGWSGSCSGNALTCPVNMNSSIETVYASFSGNAVTTYT